MRKDHKNSQRDDEADVKDSDATENGINFSKATENQKGVEKRFPKMLRENDL